MSEPTLSPPEADGRGRAWTRHELAWELALPLILFFIVAFAVALRQSERLNPDGVCYLRIAGYLAAGDLNNAVSTYWSPLCPWSMAPLVALGVDGLDAARLLQVFWGAALLVCTFWFLRVWTTIPSLARAIAMLLLVLPVVEFAIYVISPDVALSALLIAYFAALGDARWRRSTAGLVGIGLLGGAAYWAKAYALPFGLIHLPVSMWLTRDPAKLRSKRWQEFGIALGAFAVPVLLWISVLSWKQGSPTIGSSGPINHAVVGPPDEVRYHPVVFGVPRPPHVSIWETPETLPYLLWSPWESPTYLMHQIKVAFENAGLIARAVSRLDQFWLIAVTGVMMFPLAWAFPRFGLTRRLLGWTAFTIALYLSGYLLVAFEPRYANSLVLPLIVAAFFQITLGRRQWTPRWIGGLMVAALAVSLAWRWVPAVERSLNITSPHYMRDLANSLEAMNFRGPFASTSWYHGMALAYHTGEPTVGFPPDADPEISAARLKASGVNWILIWDMPSFPPLPVQDLYPPTIPRAMSIVQDPAWKLRKSSTVTFGEREAHIRAYQRIDPAKP